MAKKMKVLAALSSLFVLTTQSTYADKIELVTLERMTYDSDLVFLGTAAKRDVRKDGFVFVDTDGKKKSLDVVVTSFAVDEILKGPSRQTVNVCSIESPQKFADIEVDKRYLIFVQRSGAYFQRSYGSLSQIEVVDGKIGANYFGGGDKDLSSVAAARAAIMQAASKHAKRFRTRPYDPYERSPYKVVTNGCLG
jgi:hypothetical protein